MPAENIQNYLDARHQLSADWSSQPQVMRKAIEIAAEWDFRQVNGFSITKDELEHRRMATLSLMVSVLTEMCCAVKPWFCQGMPVDRTAVIERVNCVMHAERGSLESFAEYFIGYLPLYWHFLYISIALAAERSCMAEVHVFGRVTNDLQLKMSHRQVPYVSFGLVEWIGRRDTGHRQYFEVWAWGTAALSLADAEIHKDSRIWVQGFLELVDCTRNGGSEKDKRLKLSLTGWQTKPPRTAQRPARKQSPGAAQPPLPPVEVVDGDRERLPE